MFATTETRNEGAEAEIRLSEMIVTSEYVDEWTQPWSGKPCYRYRVRVSAAAPIIGQGEFMQYAYGSQHDFENGNNRQTEELAWMVLDDLQSAYNDPEEFFSLCIAEPDDIDLDRVRGVLAVIDYAEKIGRVLEANESDIAEARETA